MFPIGLIYLVGKEQHKDRLRAKEREQLIKAAGLRQPGNRVSRQKVAHWLGTQMVKWGSKLQRYEPEASSWTTAKPSPEAHPS